MKTVAKKSWAILLAFVVAFTMMFAINLTAFAEGEAATIEYEGQAVNFIKADGTGFGMFAPQAGTTAEIKDGKVVIHYIPKQTTTYVAIHFGLISEIPDTKEEYPESSIDVKLVDGAYDISVLTDNCGKGIAIAPVKADGKYGGNSGNWTSAEQYYLAIPAANYLQKDDPAEGEKVELTITNKTGMFKAETAHLEKADGQTTLVMALSGTGYHYLFKGTYEQAVKNGKKTENWIEGYVNADEKWEFRIPVADDETYMPLVAVSDSYYNKYLNGTNSLERAFYPRQAEIDAEAKTLVTGDYEFSKEIAVTNNVKKLNVNNTATLNTVGGPNSNNYKSTLELMMGSDSYSEAFVGSYAEASEATAAIALEEGNIFKIDVKWVEKFGQPETTVSLANGEPFYLSLKSAKNGTWYERIATLDEEAGTLVLDPSVADYTAVDAALAKVPEDLSIYTAESAAAVTEAKEAVVRDKFETQQAEVDAMAKAIEEAIAALEKIVPEIPDGTTADYSAVDAAKAKVPADLSIYTEETAKAVQDAVDAVEEDKKIDEQAAVDAMAKAIEDAIAGLEKKPADYSAVEAAKAKIPADLNIYTKETAKAVQDAVDAVEEGKKIDEQAAVDAMAKAIEEAIAALKTPEQEIAELKEKVKDLEKQLAAANAGESYSDAAAAELEKQLDAAKDELAAAETKLETAEEAKKALEEEKEKLEAAKTELEKALEAAKADNAGTTGKIAELQNQIEELQKKLEEAGEKTETPVGWKQVGGKWFFYLENGKAATGWLLDNGTWYYLNADGSMATGWIKVGDLWYYLNSNGAMASNEWIGGYWLGADGAWTYNAIGSWKLDRVGYWFGDTNGWYAANGTCKIDNVVYVFNAAGYWVQ